jgi:hypothetical protein
MADLRWNCLDPRRKSPVYFRVQGNGFTNIYNEDGDLLETLDSRANTRELLLVDGLKEI